MDKVELLDIISNFGVTDFGYTENLSSINFDHYKKWLNKDHHLPLEYLSGERADKREILTHYYPEAKSAMSFTFSYSDTKFELNKLESSIKIASYTLGFEGLDYHLVLSKKLNEIGFHLQKMFPELEYKLAIDIHPVLDRDLALRCGLGWHGKNSMLISRDHGSFFIIGSLIFNQKLGFNFKIIETDHCGQCTRCIEACPTEAIDLKNRTIISKRCISTFTIEEFKLDTLADEKMDLSSGYVFGCDICQDVCPWNKRIERGGKNKVVEFNSKQQELIDFFLKLDSKTIQKNIEKLSNNEYKNKFFNTSFFRSGKRGLLKNFIFYNKN